MKIVATVPIPVKFSTLATLMYDKISPTRTTTDNGGNVHGCKTGRTLIAGVGCNYCATDAARNERCRQTGRTCHDDDFLSELAGEALLRYLLIPTLHSSKGACLTKKLPHPPMTMMTTEFDSFENFLRQTTID